mmetsp:Transcript_6907/g.10703  ORF Transcript_6907/g.10703 Transcript_6907/m.10703 type:complete len:454 (-) Transcript_6907:128-1489(-)
MDARASSYTQPMTGQRQRYADTAPQIIPAGKSSRVQGDGAKVCVQPEVDQNERPITPDEIKKYRKSTVHEPGKIVVHYGRSDDHVPDQVFGVKAVYGDTAAGLMANYPTSELMQWRLDRQEDIYASTTREPLGKSFSRGHVLPGDLTSGEQPFGVQGEVEPTSSQVKDLVFPIDTATMQGDPEGGAAHSMYIKTHGDYAPGQQRRRGYDWGGSGIDPAAATFGGVDRAPYYDGVAKALNPLRDVGNKASASIIDKRVEDFKSTANDELGRVKNLGHGEKPHEQHIYGVPSRRFEEWSAGRLIKGDYPAAEQAPDPDLGKSLHQGYRNISGAGGGGSDPERAYGVPCIRTDLPARNANSRSVADNVNYGNEPGAVSLIFPSGGAERGVVEQDYVKPYDKDELAAFYASTGIPMEEGEFDAAFETACELDGGGEDVCTINTFQRVRMYNMSAGME